jgi:uncharacterized protein YqeY
LASNRPYVEDIAQEDDASMVVERLRVALKSALKAQDRTALSAIRSALAAIDNAGAVQSYSGRPSISRGHIAKAVAGLGAADVARRELVDREILDIIRAEVSERRLAAVEYRRGGRAYEAERLEAEAATLEHFCRAGPD